MISNHTSNEHARRILITALAFLLAVGVAFAANNAPANAGSDNADDKEYSASVAPASAAGSAAATFTVTFENEETNTLTQRAGSFSVDFGSAGFTSVSVTASATNPRTSDGHDWELVSDTNGLVIISALSGGERIATGETVSVDVTATAPAWSISGANTKPLQTDGDQEAHGSFSGGNQFTLQGNEPTITITFDGEFANCEQGKSCETNPDGTIGSATAACKPDAAAAGDGCGKDGVVAIDFLEGVCDAGGEFAGECEAIWFADTSTGSGPMDFFYVIIQAPEGLRNPTILYEDGAGDLIAAKNCQPPKRVFNCVDIKHPDYSKSSGIYPVKLKAEDPRIGFG